jgi:phenylacetate-CoA ligase
MKAVSQGVDKASGRVNGTRGGHLGGYLLLSGLQLLRRSHSLKLYREIANEPFLPTATVEANQLARLAKLLTHAENHVPYYRELFKNLRITGQDIRSFEDFAQIPILTKDIIRDRWRDLVREDVPLESLSRHYSGGSTGVPLTFYRDRTYLDASEAGTFRNFAQCGWRPGEMIAFFWGSNERVQKMSTTQFELRQWARRMYQFDPFQSGNDDLRAWLRRWYSLRPSIILGYASTIARFAQFIATQGQKVPPLRGVFSTAEKLFLPQREVIERVFGCRVYDCYGSSEVQNIATQCALGRMHVNADYVVLELDKTGGERGARPFLATSLLNYAMPFIRYRNEDCGELIDEVCGCGNNFPLMRLNIARVSDNFTLPDGRVVHGEFFTHLMYGSEGIETFQFHQIRPDQIILWIVLGSGSVEAREKAINAAVESIKALSAKPIFVEVRKTETIPLSSAGKHRFTRSDVSGSLEVQSS